MSTDPDELDFFNSLSSRTERHKEEADTPDYPGSRPPKNRGASLDTGEQDELSFLPCKELLVNGVPTKLYTVGALAVLLGKKPVTIRSWELKGWLPPPRLRTLPPKGPQIPGKESKGVRLYTHDQMLFLIHSYNHYIEEPKVPNWNGFRNHIKSQYPK